VRSTFCSEEKERASSCCLPPNVQFISSLRFLSYESPLRMHLTSPLLPLLLLAPSLAAALSLKGQKFASRAASSKDGVLKLDSNSYDEITGGDRDYTVAVVLTAMDASFKVGLADMRSAGRGERGGGDGDAATSR
jgi:hypothetical protein